MGGVSRHQVIHDLAVAFAAQKLNHALANRNLSAKDELDIFVEYSYFETEYSNACDHFRLNLKVDEDFID